MAFDVIQALCVFLHWERINLSGFEICVTTIQPGQAGAVWRPEDKLRLEDVKIRQAGASARDDKKNTVLLKTTQRLRFSICI